MIKLVATDIDGTILIPEGNFTEAVKKCIKNLTEKGIKVVLVTGRMNAAAELIAKDLGLDKDLVVDCTNNIYPTKVLESFKNLLDKEHLLLDHLRNIMPVYRGKRNNLKEELNDI